jgi:hypothetical protein
VMWLYKQPIQNLDMAENFVFRTKWNSKYPKTYTKSLSSVCEPLTIAHLSIKIIEHKKNMTTTYD